MGSSDRAFVIRIVAMMVGNTTPTGIRHLEMGEGYVFKAQDLEAGKNLQLDVAYCPSTSEDCLRMGNSVLKLGPVTARQGRDWQDGNNVLLSGNIGKGVVTGNTRSWRSVQREFGRMTLSSFFIR